MSSYISQAFDQWVAGLPPEALLTAITIGCAVWLYSIVEIACRHPARGAR